MKLLAIVFLICSFSCYSQQIEHKHDSKYGFMENKGQWNDQILLKSRFEGGNLWVQQHKILFHIQDYSELHAVHVGEQHRSELRLRQDVVHLNFVGSNEVTEVRKSNPSVDYCNFFIGNDSKKWASDVRRYSEVNLVNLYQGIDLKFIEQQQQLKYEFHVAPHVSPSLIQLEYQGQEKISIDRKGNLILETRLGKIMEEKPYAYQIINGKIKTVACAFSLEQNRLTFKLGAYNEDFKLILDPVLIFATYSGSVTDNFGMTATYGYDGTAYSAGTIYGNSYPTPDDNAFDIASNFTVQNIGTYVTTDAFISKYSADGTTMIWTTFLGGGDDTQGTETSHSLICDRQNNVYIYGATSSVDFPIQNGFQSTHGGGLPLAVQFNGSNFGTQGSDIYVAKISSDGHNLLASTYIGGSNNDGVNYKITSGNYSSVAAYDSLTTNYGDQFRGEIMLDSLGNCLVASCSRSTDFPVLNAVLSSNQGQQDGVIFKLNSNLSALIFSTYIGGSNNDACYSVKIDSSYNIVFAGGTSSINMPSTFGAWQSSYNGGKSDGFVGKLNNNGTILQRISYVGTPDYDQAFFVEIDRNDQVFLVGQSRNGMFPIFNSAYSNPNSGQFIAKLNEDLTVLVSATQFGSGQMKVDISPSAFLVDICGNIYVSGWGANVIQSLDQLSNMPVTADAFQSTPPNGFDFYLLVLERDFQSLRYATYLGGNAAEEHVDGGTSRYDKNGIVYQSVCGGCQGNSDFPTSPGAWSALNLSTNCNNLVFKFDFGLILNAQFSVDQVQGCTPFAVTFENNSNASDSYLWDFGNGDTSTVIFNPVITYTTPGDYEVTLITLDSICLLSDTAKTLIHVGLPISYTISNDTTLCSGSSFELLSSSFGTASSYHWSSNRNFSDTLNNPMSDSTLIITPQNQFETYYLMISNSGCSIIDSVVIQSSSAGLQLTGGQQVCENEDFIVTATNTSSLVYTYSWYPSSLIEQQINATTVQCVTTQPDYLYVDVSASNGCQFTDSILINVSPVNNLMVNAVASENIVIPGTQVTLTATPAGNFDYQWSPTTGLSNPSSQQTTAVVTQTTSYVVTVTDGICTAIDSIAILCVSSECEPPFVYIPNAFSPNESGKNEVFYVRGPQIVKLLFRVYDRWGELVFESTDPNKGWDGTFRNRTCDPDVYDYYVEVTCVGGNTEIIKGNVTLLK